MAKWKPESDDESDLESEGGFPSESMSSDFWYLLNRHNRDAWAVVKKEYAASFKYSCLSTAKLLYILNWTST